MSDPSPSERLRDAAADIWEAQHAHPFVIGIGSGELDPERFAVWLRQDYLFLTEYGRMLALGAARAPDLGSMRRFAEIARATLEDEMNLHRSYVAEFGITEADLEAEQMLPTTQGYTDFLVRTAAIGSYGELLAALLPCMWGYSEVGRRLADGPTPSDERYRRWIEEYSSPEFAELAGWCRELTDAAAVEAGPVGYDRMRAAFVTSSRYELAFWEMAWTGEAWPA